ncbi:MAG: hypothetical protein ACERKZ_09665 [Lachnotalea sp.]
MKNEFKIEIGLTPHNHDNINPYYWTIFCYYDDWCNEGFGWSKTPEEAWYSAFSYYQKYIITNANNV